MDSLMLNVCSSEVERDEKGLCFKLNLAIRMDNSAGRAKDVPECNGGEDCIGDC